jgi:hypothetical protein
VVFLSLTNFHNFSNSAGILPFSAVLYKILTARYNDDDDVDGDNNNNKHWYKHVPKPVETSRGGKVTILWNQQVQTDRTIPSNKPDIIIHNNEKGTCMLIDVAIPGDRNVIQKEADKILKYKDITTEIQHMWNVKTRVIPVIIGATGTISKSFIKYVSTIPGNHEVNPLPSLTLQSARDLNVPCQPKCSKALLLSYTFKCLVKKTQSFCHCTRALNSSSKGLRNYRKLPYWALHTYFGKC